MKAEATGTIKNTESPSISSTDTPEAAVSSQPMVPIHGRLSVSGVSQRASQTKPAVMPASSASVSPRPSSSTRVKRGSPIWPRARAKAVRIMRPSRW